MQSWRPIGLVAHATPRRQDVETVVGGEFVSGGVVLIVVECHSVVLFCSCDHLGLRLIALLIQLG